MSAFLYRLARWCFRHKGRVIAAWLAALALIGGLGFGLRGATDDSFTIPGASSQVALDQLEMTFPQIVEGSATMVITLPDGLRIDEEPYQGIIEEHLDSLATISYVSGVDSPFNEHIDGLVSSDGDSGYVNVRIVGLVSEMTNEQRDELTAQAAQLQDDLPSGAVVRMGGSPYSLIMPGVSIIELVGVAVAFVVLVVALGSVLAGFVPLISALVGVGLAMGITYGATNFATISSTTPMLGLMLGLAVGIDYALFIFSRHRDQLATGMDVEESAARATGTAGSAVVFAGFTVIVALIGLAVANIPFLTVMGGFAAAAVALAVIIAVTLLPAFMGVLGQRMRPKKRNGAKLANAVVRRDDADYRRGGGASGWWVRVVTRHPIVTILVVVLGLGALSIPAKDLELALPDAGQNAVTQPDRQAYDQIAEEFGVGFNGMLLVTAQIIESTDPLGIMDGLKKDIETLPGVEMVPLATPNENADTGIVQIVPTTGPHDPKTQELVEALRDKAPEWKDRYGIDTYVTGLTAAQLDVTDRLSRALLPFGIFVVGLSLVLLTLVFRSITVPIKAAVGYLLSIGGATGATTLVFNKGWLKEAVNLHEAVPVISFFPILVMGILFGLAMDYEVFLVSRMREEYVHGGDARRAVHDGFIHSAKVVVAAALIMAVVFAFFVPQGDGPIKSIAFGLALGVTIDAFLVRMTLVPAVMHLLGDKAWWLPGWLAKRMPVLDIEGEALARQINRANWPTPNDAHTVYGEGVTVGNSKLTLVDNLNVALMPGQILLVTGPAAQRKATLLVLTGRMKATSGDLKLLGYLMPNHAGAVREASLWVDPSTPQLAHRLNSTQAALIAVDDVDLIEGEARAALLKVLSEPGTRTIILGANEAGSINGELTREHLLLELDEPVLAGAVPEGSSL